ncbi:hypothetical protein PCASD_02576 [Puccinia coronata f. sp. avenae]|uniref:ubiquitinyl hydrolase 1 n=1 Tax=Puccinia coronata f. sp. avenae TaxID=200324 RepID=A0A2N5VBJ7_9BASI|nr:hypothetical protein PCASD_02576 [Puccinia coronata f. sp. avenae]
MSNPGQQFDGLPLHMLKQKAAVEPNQNIRLTDWIHQARQMYAAAIEADSLHRKESAYYHYFKSAGILQVILKHPGFTTLKVQHPAEYRVYLELAPKILACTERAKTLANAIENSPANFAPTPSSSKLPAPRRPIGGGISERIKVFESSNKPPPNFTPTSSAVRDQSKNQLSSPTSSSQQNTRPQSHIPQLNRISDTTTPLKSKPPYGIVHRVSTSTPFLPSVPSTLPENSFSPLPAPPQPFEIPPADDPDPTSQPTSYAFRTQARSRSSSREKSPSSRSPDLTSLAGLKGSQIIDWTLSTPKPPALNYSPLKPPHTSDELPKLPSDTNAIIPATLIDYFRRAAACGIDTKVLFLDLRNREDFESCRIKSTDVVCIEPLILTKNGGRGVSSMEIEQSLVLSPKKEQSSFQNRSSFDYVIMYDKRSVQLPVHRSKTELLHSSDPSEESTRLLLLLYLAIHKQEYIQRLKQPPMLLSGGIEGWIKVAGQAGVVGKGFSSTARSQRSHSTETTSSMNGVSITLRQPFNNNDDQMRNRNGNEYQAGGHTDLKRARRQVAVFQRGDSFSDSNHIVRGVADLTNRSNGVHHQPPTSTSMPTFQTARPGLPPPYSSSSYHHNGIGGSPITLPQQTLQRLKSLELYDGNHSSSEPVPSTYSSTPSSSHMPLTHYQPHSRPSVPPPSIHYGSPQHPLSIPPHTMDVRGDPGGSLAMPIYFNRAPLYSPVPPQPALLGGESRNTSPITPFSANRHGPSEVYFNPSFEDGQVGFTGLKNLGNTCYMNSTIQCLSATIPLARFFKDGSYKRCINRTNPLGTQGQLAESFAELVRVLWGAQYTFVSPITFKDAICRFAPQFRGSDQQDAQEFLGFLLDGLHEDLNLVTNKPSPLEMTPEREAALEKLPTQIASAKEWEIYKRRDNSVIVELFQGQYRSRLQCLTCNTTSTTFNTFMYLSLPIPNKRGISKVSLTQCLDAFLKEEIMEKDDAWNCPKCKTRRKATKRLSLSKLPPILLIHLKRFSFKGPFSDKLETFVQYPLYGLDLSTYVPPPLTAGSLSAEHRQHYEETARSTPESNIYDLYAVCNHFGSLSSGHYTAFARSQKDWYNIGDSRVSKTDEKSVKARSAYLLCFRKQISSLTFSPSQPHSFLEVSTKLLLFTDCVDGYLHFVSREKRMTNKP